MSWKWSLGVSLMQVRRDHGRTRASKHCRLRKEEGHEKVMEFVGNSQEHPNLWMDWDGGSRVADVCCKLTQ